MNQYTPNKVYDCNVVDEKTFHARVKNTLRILCEILSQTLGPYGNNIVIEGIPESYLTKDGHTVLSNIRFSGNIENSILSIIKKISSKMNRSVGDGTTSSIVISYYLYYELRKLLENSVKGRMMNSFLKALVDEVSKSIKSIAAFPTDDSWIKEVATISANNDSTIGDLIYDAYKSAENEDINIVVEQSSNEHFHSKLSSGYKLYYGLNSALYINNTDKKVYNQSGDVNIFVSMVPLTSECLQFISAIVQQAKSQNYRTIVFIAPGYDNFVKSFFETNKQRDPMLNYVCVEIPNPNSNTKAAEELEDLIILTGAIPYNGKQKNFYYQEEFLNHVGTQKITINAIQETYTVLGLVKGSVEINEYYTQFIGENPYQKEIVEKKIESLQKALDGMVQSYSEDSNFDNSATHLKQRINRFKGNSTLTLYIGGKTDMERKTTTYLVQDAVYAVASAKKYGLVPCMCSATIFVLEELIEKYSEEEFTTAELIVKAIRKAYHEYQKTIFRNFRKSTINHEKEKIKEEIYSKFGEEISDRVLSFVEDKINDDEVYFRHIKSVNGDDSCEIKVFEEYNEHGFFFNHSYIFNGVMTPPAPNSAETDINIFTSVVSIMNLLVTSNGFLSKNAISSTEDL